MRDPIPQSALLVGLTKPLADKLSVSTLPYHAHEVLLGFLGYHLVLYILSPALARTLCPKAYNAFNRRTRLNWDIHCVSMVQALFINTAALFVIFKDPERGQSDWKDRLWGYSPATGMVQGFAAGYFLWDLQVSAQYISVSGVGALIHAIGALTVTCIGFRPFGNYYGLSFVLYELSTPFLNVHWFCDKLNLTGSKLQLYNGIVLIATFFACRVVWGTYQSFLIYSDIYTALNQAASPSLSSMFDNGGKCDNNVSSSSVGVPAYCEIGELPMWLVGLYLTGNTVLSLLNFYWFSLMIKTVTKRFAAQPMAIEQNSAKKGQ